MALVHAPRITVQPTAAERVALATAAGIAELVAWRIRRRSDRLARVVADRGRILTAEALRDEHRAQAHRLGLR